MRGFAQDIAQAYGPAVPFTRQVVGVFVQSGFPDRDRLLEVIRKGSNFDPHTIWVCRSSDTMALEAFEELGIEPVVVELNPYWKVSRPVYGPPIKGRRKIPDHIFYDGRARMREVEIELCCSITLVFVKPDPGSLKWATEGYHQNLRVIQRGEAPKARRRKGRKPVGA